MGHQESKLSAAGVSEDTLASLDVDWSTFSPAEQCAYAFTRKLTTAPQSIMDGDIEALREYFDDLQILEIVYVVSRYNLMNRWTGAHSIFLRRSIANISLPPPMP